MIVITGATGNTGSKTAELLLKKGERVRVVGRSEHRLNPFVEKGAEAMAGDQSDTDFLTKAFTGADAAYLLIPPKMDVPDVRKYYNTMTNAAVTAIRKSGLRKIVFLSSLGADKKSGTGPVAGLHDAEKKLDALKKADIVFLRAGYFMENTLMNLSLIKTRKINGNPASPDAPVLTVATKDIAGKAAELLSSRDFNGHTVVDLFGQCISWTEMTRIIGAKIGVPDLPYVQFSGKDAVAAMTGMGLSKNLAESFVELADAISAGTISTRAGDPGKPNAPTQFLQFVEEVFYPAYMNS